MHIVKKPVWEGCRVCGYSHMPAWRRQSLGQDRDWGELAQHRDLHTVAHPAPLCVRPLAHMHLFRL